MCGAEGVNRTPASFLGVVVDDNHAAGGDLPVQRVQDLSARVSNASADP
jgi:hypothetical protein